MGPQRVQSGAWTQGWGVQSLELDTQKDQCQSEPGDRAQRPLQAVAPQREGHKGPRSLAVTPCCLQDAEDPQVSQPLRSMAARAFRFCVRLLMGYSPPALHLRVRPGLLKISEWIEQVNKQRKIKISKGLFLDRN